MRLALSASALVLLLGACSDQPASPDAAAPTAQTQGASGTAPAPRPGLWEHAMSGESPQQTAVLKICVGPEKAGQNPFAPSAGDEDADCGEPDIQRTPTGLSYTSTCSSDGMTMTSRGTVTGDLTQQYTVDAVISMSGAALPPGVPSEGRIKVVARRIGDCPAGVEPGSLVP